METYQDERQVTIERIKGTHLIPPEQLEFSHDLGKIKEIEDGVTAKNSFEGQLLGYIGLGWEMVREMGINIIDKTLSIMIP